MAAADGVTGAAGRRNHALAERAAVCDLLLQVGPDQPTLCAGWTTRDLAAHLVVRERRPLTAPGLVVPSLAGYTERVRRAYAARSFDQVVEALREPPRWSPMRWGPLDRAVNTTEMFIHHEDVRRAQPDWQPRELPDDLARLLWSRATGLAALRLRRFPATIAIEANGLGTRRVGRRSTSDGATVRLAGDPGELTIFLSGRQPAARVELTGPDELTARLATARLGI
jgi:uncharacterized protein (TIGR03085 family)